MCKVNLLDCTLRDGGYINDWNFGKKEIIDITNKMSSSGVEVVEIGFLKNESYNENRCVFNSMEQVKKIIAPKKNNVNYAVMCEVVNPLPLDLLEPADSESADIIRVIVWKTKHDENGNEIDCLKEGFEYCKGIVEKGYKLCVQPARVDQYTHEEFINTVKMFSKLNPLAIYVVDSWGTQNAEELLKYMHLADENMPKHIRLGYHGHNNMMQALSVAQAMIKENFDREIMIDASVYGIGRGAGNLNIEIIAKYMNEHCNKTYNLLPMLQVYEEYIKQIYQIEPWGYSIPYYLTAKYNCNPNYVKFIIRYKINNTEFEKILSGLKKNEKPIINQHVLKKKLYLIRNKRLCIVVPTYNKKDVISIWVNYFADFYADYGIDIIIYDSSDDNSTEIIVKSANKKNVIYERYTDKPIYLNTIDEKVKSAYKKNYTKYDYVWVCRDRSIPKFEKIYDAFLDMINKDKDALYVYPHYISKENYYVKDYTDHCEFIIQFGNLTSLGSIIYSSKILKEMIEKCPVTESGLWTPDALFHVIANRKFCIGSIRNDNFYYLPYIGSSFWIKNGSSDRLWLEYWPKLVEQLPEIYNNVKSELRRFIGWQLPPFLPFMLLPARASGSYGIKIVLKNFNELLKSGKKNTLKVLCVSMLPPQVVSVCLNNQNKILFKIIKKFFDKIIKRIIYFVGKIFLKFYGIIRDITRLLVCGNIPKKIDGIDLERENYIKENAIIKSFKMYGKNIGKKPWITVVIPTYKRKQLLEDAIASLMIQKNVEFYWDIVIVDNDEYDGHKNETQKFIEQLDWDRITYYRNEKNIGVAGNVNRGVCLAKGEWITILHDDDLLNQDYFVKIQDRIIAAEKNSKNKVAMISDMHNYCKQTLSSKDKTEWERFIREDKLRSLTDDNIILPVSSFEYLMTGGCGVAAPTAGTLYSKECYLKMGGFNSKSKLLLDDAIFAYSLTKKYSVYISSYPMGYYRQGENITSKNSAQTVKDLFYVRDQIFNSCLLGKILGYFTREEYFGRDLYFINHITGSNLYAYDFKDLVDYKPNYIRSKLVDCIAAIYRLYQKKNAVLCK